MQQDPTNGAETGGMPPVSTKSSTVSSPTTEERFGEAVSIWRKGQQLSQRKFAEALSAKGMPVDASAVSRIEKGTRSVRLVEAMTIAEVLGVELDFLISGARTPSQELQHYRSLLDHSFRPLRDEVRRSAEIMDEIYSLLTERPELLGDLKDEEAGSPESVEAYFEWVAHRIYRWHPTGLVADEIVRDGAVRVIQAVVDREVGVYVPETDSEDEDDNGVDQETS